MTSQVIPYPIVPPRPEGRRLLPSEADRIARAVLTFAKAGKYDAALSRLGLSREEKVEVAVSLHTIQEERRTSDRRQRADVIRFLDRDERMLWKMVQIARPETTLKAFLAKRDEYSARLREAERNIERRVGERRAAKSEAPPKATKAKRQARQRLPSQERN